MPSLRRTSSRTSDAASRRLELARSSDGPDYRVSLGHRLTMLGTILFPFLGVIAAVVVTWQFGWMGWPFLALLVVGWLLTAMGITIGYHRLLTHNAFRTYRPLKVIWAGLGALAVQGSPLVWCAVHRRHHEKSDQDGDPHSPRLAGKGFLGMIRGLVHAHMGWLFSPYWSRDLLKRYVPDLLRDRWIVAIDRTYLLWVVASLAVPAALGWLLTGSALGALLGLIWGGLVRIFIAHHITWSINSICHVFGRRHFHTTDNSRNNLVCGILALGEGWHNNHHAFPTSARHGLFWWQFDFSWLVIRAMARVGLAWDLVLPSPEMLKRRRL